MSEVPLYPFPGVHGGRGGIKKGRGLMAPRTDRISVAGTERALGWAVYLHHTFLFVFFSILFQQVPHAHSLLLVYYSQA